MRLFVFFLILAFTGKAGDTIYAREVIKKLCSRECYGRGYLKKGLARAEKYIVGEIRKTNAGPGFGKDFTAPFYHTVNTFPGKCELKINGRRLQPGVDFIPVPVSAGGKGSYRLTRVDSVTFADSDGRVFLSLQKKLTFSVGRQVMDRCGFEVDQKALQETPGEIEFHLRNKLQTRFKSNNISCYFNGSGGGDSMIVFTAHYDHLGGIGKNTWFPGANDNASGVSMLLNLIRHYNAHPPKNKTVFVFFAGEEAGLVGSKYYVENPPIDLKKIKFLVNLDLMGTGDDGIMVVNGAVHEEAFALLNRINAEKNLVKEIRKRGKAANSDHYWFTEAGVPAFFLYTMGGRTAYHDVYDIEPGLPLTDYVDVFKLITEFCSRL